MPSGRDRFLVFLLFCWELAECPIVVDGFYCFEEAIEVDWLYDVASDRMAETFGDISVFP